MADLRERRADAYENPRPDVQGLVPASDRRILDLGCSTGALGAALRQDRGAEVVGVEADPVYAEQARGVLDRVVVADLEDHEAWAGEVGEGFDCIVAADVLEHLRDPWTVLARAVALLAPGGSVVVSLPNVRFFWALGRLVARDRWPRDDEGIFDATHLRWFAAPDARELLQSAGLVIEAEAPQYRLRPGDWRTERAATLLAHGPLRSLLTFQHLLRGRVSDAP